MPSNRKDHAIGAADASRTAKHTRKQVGRDILHRERVADGRIAGPPIGTMGYCWCGGKREHDWPGKADGAPHPR